MNEKPHEGMIDPASQEGKRRLSPLRREFNTAGGLSAKESYAQYEGLPLITEKTFNDLSSQLNLTPSSARGKEQPYYRALDMSKGIFRAVSRQANGRIFLENIHTWLEGYSGKNAASRKETSTIGMGIILEAFCRQDDSLITKIQNVKKKDLDSAFESMGNIGGGDIIEEVLNSEELPDYQMNLSTLVGEMITMVDFEGSFYQGAVLMYKILERFHEQGYLQN